MHSTGKGFSLIEVLVALVILVVGLVGVFNLHIVSKRGSFESFQQTQASYYANDIINRMKLNRSQLASYNGVYTGGGSAPSKQCDVAIGVNVVCSNIETRDWDLYKWQQLFSGQFETLDGKAIGGLDTPTACIRINGDNVSVVMTWRGIRSTADGGANLVTDCGTASDRRRTFVLDTVII